jgi:phosphoglycerate dehydrogenase-like enzyme
MVDEPDVLLLQNFPAENRGGPADLAAAIRDRLGSVRLDRARDHADAVERIETADVVVEHGYGRDLFERAERLEWVQSLSAGVDRYDLEFLEANGVVLTSAAGVHATPIAEHVLAFLLAVERGLDRALRQAERAEWRRWTPGELTGKTTAVLGVGAVGDRVAELASAHGMTVLGTKRDPSTGADNADEVYGPDETHAVLGRADYVVVACPLTEETRGLLDAAAFSSMSRDAVLVNVARGEVVVEDALVTALQRGQIRAAGLDVFEHEPLDPSSPLWDLSNALLTPHLAGGSPKFTERVADLFATNYERYVAGERDRMENRVV